MPRVWGLMGAILPALPLQVEWRHRDTERRDCPKSHPHFLADETPTYSLPSGFPVMPGPLWTAPARPDPPGLLGAGWVRPRAKATRATTLTT